MNAFHELAETTWFLPLVILLAIWDGIWKLISMWKAARNNHKAWFICLAVFNTLGVLPVLYLTSFKNKN
jgi:hypothetical protein